MKNVICLFFLLFSFAGISQVWIDSNAVWNYKILHENNPGFYEYHYDQDTIIQGHTCQKITGTRNQWFWNGSDWDPMTPLSLWENYTYVNGDTVFYFFNDQFFMLYNFGANIGDQWMIADTNLYHSGTMCNDSAFVEVIDTGSMFINSTSYRTITLQTLDSSSYALNGLFVERFGFIPDSSRWRMAPFPQSCDQNFIIQPWHVDFTCFHDKSFPLYNPSGENCQFVPSILSLNDIEPHEIQIYPNPAADMINISMSGKCTVQIFSSDGSEVYKASLTGSETIDITKIPNGVYYVLFAQEETYLDVKRLVVNH